MGRRNVERQLLWLMSQAGHFEQLERVMVAQELQPTEDTERCYQHCHIVRTLPVNIVVVFVEYSLSMVSM